MSLLPLERLSVKENGAKKSMKVDSFEALVGRNVAQQNGVRVFGDFASRILPLEILERVDD